MSGNTGVNFPEWRHIERNLTLAIWTLVGETELDKLAKLA